ncbi:transcription initiation factor TFIID subunit 6-like [Gossypium hirsutum]|uniref:Transcription initiation factor TFIID subunit 6-like n=1 Tax=Gossypium hirsutum TaxID=3635 RepID=A0ABM2ZD87_GOSHI|nr:transcription initiation factor TFIID subunit 6-like [Gossypium hirsutum]
MYKSSTNFFASSFSSVSSSSNAFIESTANGTYLGWNKAPEIEIDGGRQAKALGFGERGRWLRKHQPICRFASRDALRFKKPAGHKDLFYIDDKDVEFKEVRTYQQYSRLCFTFAKSTTNTSVTSHWLPIEGIQPEIPENASIEAPSNGKKAEYKEDGLSVDVKLPIKHVLSRELKLYFDKIVDITMNKSVSILFKQALLSLETDSGLHPLVLYCTCFIADEVARNLNNFPLMFALMRVAWSLLQNEHLHIKTYLHQLMPSIITCLVAKRLGNKFTDNHWELRNFVAKLVASICKSVFAAS